MRALVTIGHPADKVELLMDARALISPIDWEEPFGLVLLEAWANGKPNVVYRAGGPAELVRHEVEVRVEVDAGRGQDAVRRVFLIRAVLGRRAGHAARG